MSKCPQPAVLDWMQYSWTARRYGSVLIECHAFHRSHSTERAQWLPLHLESCKERRNPPPLLLSPTSQCVSFAERQIFTTIMAGAPRAVLRLAAGDFIGHSCASTRRDGRWRSR